ncbi:MAG: heparinase II/III domain-containing protein, partial [Limisphaerales bacterium]
RFYHSAKPESGGWDYGDCDNAWVTPLFAKEENAAREWWRWFDDSSKSAALRYWWGDFCSEKGAIGRWENRESYSVFRSEDWFMRFDHSALGYLSMAPHGHLDALHVSVWFRGEPVIIDPGTGGYYADKTVRDYLAGWSAHNGPHLRTPPESFPKRYGTFLWGAHHKEPGARAVSPVEVSAEFELPYGKATRSVTFVPETNSIRIRDTFSHADRSAPVVTRWKFAPEYLVANPVPGTFQIGAGANVVRLQISAEWKAASSYNPPAELRGKTSATLGGLASVPLASVVSPAFRSLSSASFLTLEGSGEGPFELIISPG